MPDSRPETLRPRPWEILVLLPIGTLIGGLLGASFGAFNGWLNFMRSAPVPRTVSMLRYARVSKFSLQDQLKLQQSMMDLEATLRMNMVKHAFTLGWRAGLVISLVLVIGIAVIAKLRCPFRMALGVQLRVIRGAFLFWLVGGINALILASVAPAWLGNILNPASGIFVRFRFRSAQTATPSFLREAWVWGSVWGFRIGLVLATISCLISFAAKWRQQEKDALNRAEIA